MDHWNGQQRAFAIKMFYKNNDSLEGFSKVPFFLCHLYLQTFLAIVRFIYEQVTVFQNISGLGVFESHCIASGFISWAVLYIH